MAEYYAFQAALCFSVAHVLIRRGLVGSNALTCSLISLATTGTIFWLLVVILIPLSALWTPPIGYFIAAGIFAPAIGQTLGYIGIERIGVARSTPIVNSAPIFSSGLAVLFLGEVWTAQNILGTLSVIVGVIILSSGKSSAGEWRRIDILYPLLGAVAFGLSTTLRKSGLSVLPIPLLGAAVTVGTAFIIILIVVRWRGGRRALKFDPASTRWLFVAAVVNTGAILSVFSALNVGKVVRVEPLIASNPLLTILWVGIFLRQIERISARIVLGALFTVMGTTLVVTAH
jgi:drug/metabolite transporter (DMT)-like permease